MRFRGTLSSLVFSFVLCLICEGSLRASGMQYAQNVVISEITWTPFPMHVGVILYQYVQWRAVIISGGDQGTEVIGAGRKNGRPVSKDDISALEDGGDIIQTPERKQEVDEFAQQLISRGWEYMGQGPVWYSYRFAKR